MNNIISLENKKLYTEEVILPSGATVELRGMKTQEMDILASRRSMKDGNGINEIAKNCIVSSVDFDYDSALQGDRYSILINIRRITYSGPYMFNISCPQCDNNSQFKVDLESLPVKYLDGRPSTGLKFTMPRSEHNITYHLPTGREEREIIKLRKNHPDDVLSLSLMCNIDKIEGIPMKSLEWFKDLDACDVVAFKEELEEVGCGIETGLDLCCDSCGAEFETELPITSNFFLPKKVKKV